LHERFAGWLEGRGDEFDEVVGYHLEQAYRCLAGLGRPGQRAGALAERAGERLAGPGLRAYARADSRAAVNLLERAADLLPGDDTRRLGLLPFLGRALRAQGHLDRADAVLSEAVERGQAVGERAVAADAGMALTDLRSHRPARTGVGREDILREIDAAIQVFGEVGDEAGLTRALLLRGQYRFWGGEAGAALPDLEQVARRAHDAGDRADEAVGIQYICAAMRVGPTPVGEALARLEELDSRAAINGRVEEAILIARAHLVATQGRFDAARGFASQATAVAAEHGLDDSHAGLVTGHIELLAGEPVTAERELRGVCEHYVRVGELGFLSSAVPYLVDALLAQGRDEEALVLTERWQPEHLTLDEDVDAHVGWRRVRARSLARVGRLGEAERLAREGVSMASATDVLELRAQALADLGEVLSLAGRPQESRTALEEALGLYQAKGHAVEAGRIRGLLAAPPVEA
jgi:tetratricopeptide (TPR) repeat protein